MENLDNCVDSYKKTFLYEFDNDIMLNYYPKRIIERMNEGSLLELGLGHGYTIRQFIDQVGAYTILEGSQMVIDRFLKEESELAVRLEIVKIYFENFNTELKYDNIVMGFVLEHVDDPELIVSMYKNFLAPGGKLFISVPNSDSAHRRIGYYAGVLNDLKQLSASDEALGHKRYYDLSMLEELAERNNLKIVNVEGIFLKPFSTAQMQQLDLSKEMISGMLTLGRDYPELSNAILMELELA